MAVEPEDDGSTPSSANDSNADLVKIEKSFGERNCTESLSANSDYDGAHVTTSGKFESANDSSHFFSSDEMDDDNDDDENDDDDDDE